MKNSKIFLLSLLLCFCIIQATSAATSEETYTSSDYYITKMTGFNYGTWGHSSGTSIILRALDNADNYNGLSFLTYEGSRIRIQHNSAYTQYINSIPVTIDGYSAILSAEEHYNLLGGYVSTDIWIYFENPSLIKSLPSAPGYITVSLPSGYATVPGQEWTGLATYSLEGSSDHRILWSTQAGYTAQATREQVVTAPYWENTLSAEYGLESGLGYITLTRNDYHSNLSVYDLSNNLIYNNYEPDDISKMFLGYEYKYRLENAFGDVFEKILQMEDTTKRIKVLTHVWSNADDSLIGGALVTYNATDGSDYQSQTLRTGEGIFNLLPGVDYAFAAEADGYVMQKDSEPVISFTGDTQFGIYMTPVGNVTPGLGLVNFKVYEYTLSGSVIPLKNAIIEVGNTTLLTNSAGYNSFTIDKNATLSYKVYKEGYNSFSISYKPIWTQDAIDEYVFLRSDDLVLPGEPTAEPTPDRRTANQKAESAANIIFDNIEHIAYLGVVVTILALVEMMAGGGKKR